MIDLTILVLAAFGAGALNTVAGGGTFLTLPALILTGVPPVAANATSAAAVFPGYAGGALGFAPEMRAFDRALLVRLTLVTLAGGLLGSILLLLSSDAAFSVVVPFLLLAATATFLWSDRIRAFAAARSRGVTPHGAAGLFCVAVYGGYFNGGLGIVLLALFALWVMTDLHRMNGLKVVLSFALSAISVATFAVAGLVHWAPALAMMVAATAGGYAGAPLARVIPMRILRYLIAAIGLGMSVLFFVRLF